MSPDELANIQFSSRRSAVMARRGMVATSQPLAAQAGLSILRAGGNAADAAVATAAVLNVVEPTSTGIGGDMFALFWRASDRTVHALNGSGRAPAAASLEQLLSEGHKTMPNVGPYPVTVPGAVSGWEAIVKAFGRLSLADALQPAIEYAEQGYPVSEIISRGWRRAAETKLQLFPGGEQFLFDGAGPQPGQTVRLPNLGASLRLIAQEGAEGFYRGALAHTIADYVQGLGGWLRYEDLAAHVPTWEQPISTRYRDAVVYECPPNGQGLAALLALNLVQGFDLTRLGHNSPQTLHILIEAMRLAFADAFYYVSDPVFNNIPVGGLLADAYSTVRRRQIALGKAATDVHYGQPFGHIYGDTVKLEVVDGEGNACSFINSLYDGIGSGLVVPGTGIALQNRGANFNLDPNHPNHLEPGKRPYHTIIPALATRHGELWLSFGVMGGFMQPQGHLQVLVNMLDFSMDAQRALDALRFMVIDPVSGRVQLEEGTPSTTLEALTALGHKVEVVTGYGRLAFGGGQVIERKPDGVLWAGSDPRKDGCAVGY